VKLLERDRVDYIIRMRITHFSELKIQDKPNRYQFYYLDERMEYKQVAAACSNSELGHTVINKYNNLINQALYKTYLEYRQEWDPNNTVYRKVYTDYFIEGKPNPNVVE
jgi:hypothetical protein